MSADNWRTCPRCEKDAHTAANLELQQAIHTRDAMYGQVSLDAFAPLQRAVHEAEVAEANCGPTKPTLREDWEVGIFDAEGGGAGEAELFIDYRASCSICKLEVKFRHTQAVV